MNDQKLCYFFLNRTIKITIKFIIITNKNINFLFSLLFSIKFILYIFLFTQLYKIK